MLKTPSAQPTEFSLAEARHIIKDLFRPNMKIYWVDFLITVLVGHVCYSLVRNLVILLPEPIWLRTTLQVVCFFTACLLYYRAALFIHELMHLSSKKHRAFRFVWNLLCGIPFLTPSFIYYPHVGHHRRSSYGTKKDGEYMPLGHRSTSYILYFLALSFVIPPFVIARFLLLTPLTWVSPRFRNWIHQRASSLVMEPTYLRPQPSKKALRVIRLQELLCFLWCLGIAVIPPVFLDRWPIPFLIQAYLTGVCIIMINAIRTLGAHRWYNRGEEMTFLGQLSDSVNYPHGSLFTELWAPVGTRYHALHHLFPSLPYHAMPEAHRRLMEQLPADSLYHQTESHSLRSVLLDLWGRARDYDKSGGSQGLEDPAGSDSHLQQPSHG